MGARQRARLGATAALIVVATTRLAHAGDDGLPPLPDFFAPAPTVQSPLVTPPASPATEPAPRAPEAPWPVFGSRGQVVVSGGSSVSVSSTQNGANPAGVLSLTFSPNLDYFFVRNVSIGLAIDLEYASGQGYGSDYSLVHTNTSTVSGGPRFGVNVPFGRTVSIWPLLTLAVESAHRDETLVSGTSPTVPGSIAAPSTTRVGPSVNLYLPLLFQLTPHFFAGVGPSVFHEFGRAQGGPDVGGQRTYVGAGIVVGGYFGGAEPAVGPALETARVDRRRFGQAHQMAITNEEVLRGGYTSYAGTGASIAFLSVALGVDYFPVDHVSIGVVAGGGYTRQAGPDPTGATVTYVGRSFSAGPRVGVDIPLGSVVSIYPRVALTLGPGGEEETAKTSANDSTDLDLAVSISVPLLVHPVSHFFIGFGPYLTHDLWRPVTYPNGVSTEIELTTIGASLLVGGWL